MSKLTGKIALVTGASKGIGAGIAKELAALGATVIVNYSTSKEGADKVVAAITAAGGKAVALGGSVAKVDEVESLFAEIKKTHGHLDILINNAGVYAMMPIDQITEATIDTQFSTNVKGLLLTTQAAVALFPETGGSIVNISSVVTESTPPASAVYAATKGAVNAITQAFARELGPRKIRVNAVSPGPVETEGTATFGPFFEQMKALTPLGRIGQPDDIATVVAFLASEDARWITGSILQAAGGFR